MGGLPRMSPLMLLLSKKVGSLPADHDESAKRKSS